MERKEICPILKVVIALTGFLGIDALLCLILIYLDRLIVGADHFRGGPFFFVFFGVAAGAYLVALAYGILPLVLLGGSIVEVYSSNSPIWKNWKRAIAAICMLLFIIIYYWAALEVFGRIMRLTPLRSIWSIQNTIQKPPNHKEASHDAAL